MEKNYKRRIYFEKQSQDRLCGLHCLNSLLQGPFYDVSQLSEIALDLDKQESLLMNKNTHENVDVDGNYNIQVLSSALQKNQKVTLVPIGANKLNSILNESGGKVEAFILNSSTHWFCIRKIQDVWYDLNSTNKTPLIISDFFLSAFITGSMDIGYSNFLVQNLPDLPDEEYYFELMPHQHLYSVNELEKIKKVEEDLRKEREKAKKSPEEIEEQDNKFKAFQGKGVSLNENEIKLNNKFDHIDDDEMKMAMQMSLDIYVSDLENQLPKEPSENEDCFTIMLRYEEHQLQRRFNGDNTINDVKNFVKSKLKTYNDIELFEAWPRKVYSDDFIKIKQSGFSKNQLLMVRLL